MKKQKVAVVGTILTIDYPSINKRFTVDYAKYMASVQSDAMAHGFKQKFGDAKSGESAAEKFEMVKRIHENLLTGQWELTATPDHSGIIIEAVCNLKKWKEKEVRKTLEANPDKLKEFGTNVKVKAEIARIRAERAAAAAEGDDTELDITL